MSNRPSQPVTDKDRMVNWADESDVGDHFAGESKRENRVGIDREVEVTLFKRNIGSDNPGTFFLRVSLGSQIKKGHLFRYDVDIERYSNDAELFKQVAIAAGALAERDIGAYGATWDPEYVASQAHAAAKELLKELQ